MLGMGLLHGRYRCLTWDAKADLYLRGLHCLCPQPPSCCACNITLLLRLNAKSYLRFCCMQVFSPAFIAMCMLQA